MSNHWMRRVRMIQWRQDASLGQRCRKVDGLAQPMRRHRLSQAMPCFHRFLRQKIGRNRILHPPRRTVLCGGDSARAIAQSQLYKSQNLLPELAELP